MTNKAIKLVAILLLVILTIASLSQVNFAKDGDDEWDMADASDIKNMYDGAKDTTGATSSINKLIGSMITVVQVVGTGVAIIMLIVLAIKYISAAPGDKAEIKKHAVVYVVGSVVLFAATGILQIIKNFAGNVDGPVNSKEVEG